MYAVTPSLNTKRYAVQVRLVQEITSQREKAREDKEEAVNEAGELRVLLDEAVAGTSSAEDELRKVQDRCNTAERGSKISATDAEQARYQVREANKQARSAAASSMTRKKQLEAEMSEAQNKLGLLSKKIDDLSILNSELKSAKSNIEDDLRAQMQACKHADINASKKQKRIDSLHRMMVSADQEIQDWQDREQIDGLTMAKMEKDLSESKRSELDMTGWLVKAEEKLGSLEVAIKHKDARLAALEGTVIERTNALEEAQNQKSDVQAKYNQQSVGLSETIGEVVNLQRRCQQQHEELANANEALTSLQGQYDRQSEESKAKTTKLDEEYSSKLHNETTARKAAETELTASREQRDRETLALSEERERLSQTQMALSESQIAVSSQDLSSLQQKYDTLKTEAMNHWKDMAAKDTAAKAANTGLLEEKAQHQSTKASLKAKIQDRNNVIEKKSAELQQAHQNLSSLEVDKQQLLETMSKAKENIKAIEKASDDKARHDQADLTRINGELSETRTVFSTLQHKKGQLLERVRDADNAANENKQQRDAVQNLVDHYRTAFQELVMTASPERLEDMSAQELTQALRDRNVAATAVIYKAKDHIESLTSQRDRLASVLKITLQTCVESLSLCEEMVKRQESLMPTAAKPSYPQTFPEEVGDEDDSEEKGSN
ncbi:hypothetical protein KC349_g1265 [Hortaea werneckii]|nr:hypothetical protein KC349_g1265 [Hortaea werneckii]